MRIVFNVYVDNLEKVINRKIEVSSSIKLDDFCEYIIVSLNGYKTYSYFLDDDDYEYYKTKGDDVISLKDLDITKESKFVLFYDLDSTYYINIDVIDIVEEDNKDIFKVIDGKGYGILEGYRYKLVGYFNSSLKDRKELLERFSKSFLEFINKKFDLDECNNRVFSYMDEKKERIKPKTYIFNISLEGFAREIKRKIAVNNDISIDDFCMKVVLSMRGDLFHCYGLKVGKEMLDEELGDMELNSVVLKDKAKFKVIYDFGDNWIINVSLSKIVDGYSESSFSVLSGKGYGLVDDCGGPYYLNRIFNGENEMWEKVDINDFDLDECNRVVGNK